MGYRLPPLNTLRIFEAAGRFLSFKAASEELHVTPSAVSHAIQSLEDWLGVTLFARSSKGLTLTHAGRSYLGYVSEAIALLARGTQGLPGFAPRNELSISCAPTFAARWLIPNLKSFQEVYPAVSVSIDTVHRRVAFPGDHVDVAIRRGDGPWPGLFAVPLAQETLFPVVSPTYFDAHGPIRSIDDFARLTLLRVSSITEDWPSWFDQATSTPVAARNEICFDAIHLALDAAVQGLGVALGRRPLIDDDLASGRLIKAMEPAISGTTRYWLVCSPESSEWPEVACFRSWIEQRLHGAEPKTLGPQQSNVACVGRAS